MIDNLLSFFYVSVCLVLIGAVLLQHYRSDQSKGSNSYFGGAGNKHFLYNLTFYAIGLFFILAILKYSLHQKRYEKTQHLSDLPVYTQNSPKQNSEIQPNIQNALYKK